MMLLPLARFSGQAGPLWRASKWFASSSSHFSTAASKDQDAVACLSSSRAVVQVQGQEVVKFLQGMTTNDMRPLEKPGAGPVYATLVTPKGKFLHDPIFYRHPGADDALLMEVDVLGKEKAIDWLNRYKLRRKIQLSDVSSQWSVWVHYGPQAAAAESCAASWPRDPRLPSLGFRTLLPAGQQPALAGVLLAGVDGYKRWRCMQGVAEGEVELIPDKTAPLEFNTDVLNGVSYNKGCYIGQERNSYTHYRGIIRRRCMPVRLEPPVADLPVGAEVAVSGSGEVVGNIRAAAGDWGLAHLKLQPALKAAEGQGLSLVVKGGAGQVAVTPVRPSWWLKEWGAEEGGEGPEGAAA